MKLYYTKGACSLACRILINELGLPCEYESVDLKNKKTETKEDYLAINPKGAVPVLITDEGETLTENAVIHQYLADENNSELLPKVGSFERYRVLEWLNYITTELHKGFGVFFNPMLPEEVKQDVFIPMMKKKLSYVDGKLEAKKYLMGNKFSLPDGYLFVMLTWAKNFKFNFDQWPNLSRYFDELKQRESISKALKEEGLR